MYNLLKTLVKCWGIRVSVNSYIYIMYKKKSCISPFYAWCLWDNNNKFSIWLKEYDLLFKTTAYLLPTWLADTIIISLYHFFYKWMQVMLLKSLKRAIKFSSPTAIYTLCKFVTPKQERLVVKLCASFFGWTT